MVNYNYAQFRLFDTTYPFASYDQSGLDFAQQMENYDVIALAWIFKYTDYLVENKAVLK